MVEDQGKEEEKFDFTGEGEAVNYISLAQARLLAMRTAQEIPGNYGRRYQNVPMFFESVEDSENEDYYVVTLSFRPQTAVSVTPGREQFFIEKEGTVSVRQVLSPLGQGRRFPALSIAIGLVIVGVIAVVAVIFVAGGLGDDKELVAAVVPTETPAPTNPPMPIAEPTAIPPDAIPTRTPIPAAAPTSMATPTTIPTATPRPTYTPFPTATPRPTYTPRPAPTARVIVESPTPNRVPVATPVKIVEQQKQDTAKADPNFNPIYGGVINMAQYADVRQRLIHQSSVLNMNMSPVFNNLVEYNPETDDVSDLRCDMCTSWELAENGMTYTFHIHPDAKWHDGVPVTSRDIVFSFESMVNPDQFEVLKGRSTSSHCSTGLYFETGNSRAVDPKTFELTTMFPSGGFLSTVANETCPMIAHHTVVNQKIAQGGKDVKVLNGSGPFKLTNFVKEVQISYEKDPTYWKTDRNGGAMPYVDGLEMFVITDSGRQIAAFKTGQILTVNQSLDNLTSTEAIKLDEEMDNLTVHWAGPVQAFYVFMNTMVWPFSDVRVRRALHLALHRQPIIQTFSGGTDALGYPNPEGFWYSQTEEEYANMPGFRELNGEKHPDDLAEAKRLLDDAGLAGGLKAELTARNVLGYPDLAIQVKEQLRKNLGWDITIRTMESGAGFDAYWAGDTQFAVQSGGIYSTGPDAIWARLTRGTIPQWTGGGRGKFMVPCRESDGVCLDELQDLQMRELDQEKRKAIVAEMSDMVINDDHSNPYLFWGNHHHAVNHKIKNFHMTIQGRAWEHVWCDPDCK